MSNTPRTDAAELEANIGVTHFDHKDLSAAYHFARQLERELNAANSIIRQQQLLDEANLRLHERIKRLEDALNGTVKWIVDLANSGDAGFWDVDEQPEIIAARAVLKKEIKQ